MIPLDRRELLRAEYMARINRVIDFIEKNIGRELRLDELARVANFSAFHFHRVFGALVGEPLYAFILRVRAERAAAALISDDGAELERMDYLELIARVTSHIPDKGQVMVRYYGLYANAHRGKVRKAGRVPVALGMLEEELPRIPSKGWAEMIRKVCDVDPMICPRCGGRMKVVNFLTEYAVVDRIIRHLELTFTAAKPPPAHVFEQVALMAAEESGEYE